MRRILFVTDYVCPYCLVAKCALEKALEKLEMEAEIVCHPFELTPEPRPRVDTYHDAVRKARYQVLEEPCRALGLDMKLPPRVIPRPYTRLAFEGRFVAAQYGLEKEYNERVYCAYFLEEKDIGDPEVLTEIAVSLGIDGEEYRQALSSGRFRKEQEELNRIAREEMKIRQVPTIFLDGKEVSVSSYTEEEFLNLLQEDGGEAGAGFACGPDGC